MNGVTDLSRIKRYKYEHIFDPRSGLFQPSGRRWPSSLIGADILWKLPNDISRRVVLADDVDVGLRG